MRKILIIFIFSISIAQVFSEYSYTGASHAAMAGTITANIDSKLYIYGYNIHLIEFFREKQERNKGWVYLN